MLFFLNSGSIVALLTFIGSLFSKGDQQSQTAATVLGIAFLHSFYWYGIALAFTVAASGLAYINWAAASELEDDPGDIYRFVTRQNRIDPPPKNPNDCDVGGMGCDQLVRRRVALLVVQLLSGDRRFRPCCRALVANSHGPYH